MAESAEKSKRFYSYDRDTKAIAHIDMVGFSALTEKFGNGESPAQLVFTFFENCILPYRNSMKAAAPEFGREVPADLTENGHRHGFWYKEVALGAVNFIYLSDTVILYSNSLTHLFRELSAIMGATIVFGVPVRATVTIGDLHHSEWVERPGSAICLYGAALSRAAQMDKTVMSKKAMRVGLSSEVVTLAQNLPHLRQYLLPPGEDLSTYQLKWWREALTASHGRSESEQLRWHYDRWYEDKEVGKWFEGKNKEDADKAIQTAESDLKSLNR